MRALLHFLSGCQRNGTCLISQKKCEANDAFSYCSNIIKVTGLSKSKRQNNEIQTIKYKHTAHKRENKMHKSDQKKMKEKYPSSHWAERRRCIESVQTKWINEIASSSLDLFRSSLLLFILFFVIMFSFFSSIR